RLPQEAGHEIEVVEPLDPIAVDPGFFEDLAQCGRDDFLARFDGARHALPEPRQDCPAWRAVEHQHFESGASLAEDPDVDQIRSKRAQSRSNRSIGTMKTVAPPTST